MSLVSVHIKDLTQCCETRIIKKFIGITGKDRNFSKIFVTDFEFRHKPVIASAT